MLGVIAINDRVNSDEASVDETSVDETSVKEANRVSVFVILKIPELYPRKLRMAQSLPYFSAARLLAMSCACMICLDNNC